MPLGARPVVSVKTKIGLNAALPVSTRIWFTAAVHVMPRASATMAGADDLKPIVT